MKKKWLLFLTLPTLLLSGCNKEKAPLEKVSLLYGKMHGEVASWSTLASDIYGEDEPWYNLSYLTKLNYAELSGLVNKEENFVLVAKGNEGSCGCWQGFHRAVGIYAVSHHIKVYVIEVSDLVKGSDYFGLKCATGIDEIAIYKEGKILHNHDDNEWGNNYLEFAEWMNQRINLPKMFEIEEDQLEDLYHGNDPFFIYYRRGNCGDCQYIEETSLKDYLLSNRRIESYTFCIDCDPWRSIIDEQGVKHGMDDQTQYDEERTWGEYVSEEYAKKKAHFGMDDEEAGLSSGSFPTFYHVLPDGKGTTSNEVIDMAGVFYNDRIDETETIIDTYFTEARLDYACLDYLKNSSVEHKVLLNQKVKEGTYQARINRDNKTYHDGYRPYHEPIFYALLDASILL